MPREHDPPLQNSECDGPRHKRHHPHKRLRAGYHFPLPHSHPTFRSAQSVYYTDETDAPLFRLPVEPTERNGLRSSCRMMVSKSTTVSKSKVGTWVGRLDDEDVLKLNRAMIVFLGLAGSRKFGR
jgi:mRNA-degrading endonuclease toxin of MazEF toxin-antitoxin module